MSFEEVQKSLKDLNASSMSGNRSAAVDSELNFIYLPDDKINEAARQIYQLQSIPERKKTFKKYLKARDR